MEEQKIKEFAKHSKHIQNLVGNILQQGEIYVSDDNTLSWKIRVLKGEIILIETDTLVDDPMEREETFSNLYAIDLLYDRVKSRDFSKPFDKEQLLGEDRTTLLDVEEIMDRILPKIQTHKIEEER